MTLKEFREKTKDLDENLVLLSLYGEYDNYHFIEHISIENHINDTYSEEFSVCEDLDKKIDERFAEEYDVELEDLEITKVILLS
jgi:hypothetical protein